MNREYEKPPARENTPRAPRNNRKTKAAATLDECKATAPSFALHGYGWGTGRLRVTLSVFCDASGVRARQTIRRRNRFVSLKALPELLAHVEEALAEHTIGGILPCTLEIRDVPRQTYELRKMPGELAKE